MGIILFALICGYLPFDHKNNTILYKKIIAGDFKIPKFISANARDILKGILNVNPEKRYKLEDIRNHKWFKLYNKEIENYDEEIQVKELYFYENSQFYLKS